MFLVLPTIFTDQHFLQFFMAAFCRHKNVLYQHFVLITKKHGLYFSFIVSKINSVLHLALHKFVVAILNNLVTKILA